MPLYERSVIFMMKNIRNKLGDYYLRKMAKHVAIFEETDDFSELIKANVYMLISVRCFPYNEEYYDYANEIIEITGITLPKFRKKES
jgi:hypothetical protein